MSDKYTIDELADALGINRYKVVWLKRQGKIPANAISSDGFFIKSVINPFIEAYTNNSAPAKKREKANTKRHNANGKVKRAYKRVAAPAITKNDNLLAPVVPEVFASVSDSAPDFDAFARRYWQQNNRAVEVLLSPSEIGTKIFKSVNEALRFAYNELKK
jgi:hypothetical protein